MFVGIKDGVTVHLVIKSTGKVAASAANKTPTATPNAVSDLNKDSLINYLF